MNVMLLQKYSQYPLSDGSQDINTHVPMMPLRMFDARIWDLSDKDCWSAAMAVL
jgi:hypothetical protein